MKTAISMAVALILLGAVAPTTTAREEFDVDAWAEHCVSESEAVASEFEQYPNGVPQPIAFTGVQRINAACYATLPVQAPTQTQTQASPLGGVVNAQIVGDIVAGELGDLADPGKKVCSGNVATAMGWQDSIVVLGKPYPVMRGPASSQVTWYKTGTDQYAGEGYIRSTLDDVTLVVMDGGGAGAIWFFAGLPMGGSGSVGFSCLLGLFYDLDASFSGLPLVWLIQPEAIKSAIPPPLQVDAGGGLCLPIC